MYALILSVLAGCVTQPASVRLDGEPNLTIHELAPVNLPMAVALDAKGNEIQPQPAITWTVAPPEIASLGPDGKSVNALAEGSAQITATAGTATASFTLNVQVPDKVELSGLVGGQTVEAGQNVPVLAKVLDGETAIENMAVVWTTSAPEIGNVVDGNFVATAPGEVTITATAGAQAATVNVTVIPSTTAPVDPAAAPQG